jgi:5-methylcytosine-specific restriction endonuclease McrA
MIPVIVLGRDYRPVFIWGHRKAFVLVFSQRAEVLLNRKNTFIKGVRRRFIIPLVIRVNYVGKPVSSRPTRWGIYIRDNFTCGYCGRSLKDKELTVDHVVPKSRGGPWSWENLVTCCPECNQRKGNRTPREAGMELLITPYRPLPFEVELKKWTKKIDDEFTDALAFFCPSYAKIF